MRVSPSATFSRIEALLLGVSLKLPVLFTIRKSALAVYEIESKNKKTSSFIMTLI
jgi:hypothetical protein